MKRTGPDKNALRIWATKTLSLRKLLTGKNDRNAY